MIGWRPFAEAVRTGVDALRAHPMRTALSTLGIVIAVASLVATLSVFDGVIKYASEEITRETGVETVTIRPITMRWERRGVYHVVRDYVVFTTEDGLSARRDIEGVRGGTTTLNGQTRVERNGIRRQSEVTLATADYGDFSQIRMAAGRFFTATEALHNTPVIVINHHLAAELSDGRDPLLLLDRSVKVGGRNRTIIGIVEPVIDERDNAAFVPLKATDVLNNPSRHDLAPTIHLKAAGIDSVEFVQAGVQEWLARRYGRWEGRAEIRIGLERVRRLQQEFFLAKLLIIGIAGIVLTVGGVGIMNVMLTSVTERTREIGIRKAVGARSTDVMVQFLVEAVAVGVTGSVLGILGGMLIGGGLGIAFRMLTNAHVYPVLTVGTVLVAVLSSAFTGLIFGTYPARKAARLAPIQAIARE